LGEEYRSLSFLCIFLHSTVTSYPSRTNILHPIPKHPQTTFLP
jgi:hypothetical protein